MPADEILSASSPEAGIAIVAGITTELVRQAQARHALAPTATAAVGRLVTAAALLGTALKGTERISLQIGGDGPIGSLSAEAWLIGESVGARARARNPQADLPLNHYGKFDVVGLIGAGSLQVTKSYDVGQPYAGVVPLFSGEIAEDVASYLAQSEQIPSIVALGVLAGPEGVIAAGGIIAQVLPGADEKTIAALEARALALPPVTSLIANGADAKSLMDALVGDLTLRAFRSAPVEFACLCTREKVEVALLGLGADELRGMARSKEISDASCEFCGKRYEFTADELDELVLRFGSE